jgi:hypothetical protein
MFDGQVLRRQPGVAADRQQDIVEVMRDAARHRAQRVRFLQQFAVALDQ